MTQQPKQMPTKAERHEAIRAARGMFRLQPGGPAFAEQMAKWKAEDREIERCRDERLASLIKR